MENFCSSPLGYALAAVGAYAIAAHVVAPLADLAARLRLHKQPNWRKLTSGAKGEAGCGWALITGASTGMGREYALHLAIDKGMNVIIIADPATAAQLAEVEAAITKATAEQKGGPRRVIAIVADLLDDTVYGSIIIPKIAPFLDDVSVLINNVGMCILNRFDRSTVESDMRMFTLNVVPMIRMTKLVLPSMKKARRGCIISMASLSGDIPTAFLAVYGATKTFVRSFNAAIREELRRYGGDFSVTVPMPFGVKTPLYDKIDQNTKPGVEKHDALCVDARPAVLAIVRKMGMNREHYGHDLHDLVGTAMSLMSKEKASAEFRKALVDSLPRPPGLDPSKEDL